MSEEPGIALPPDLPTTGDHDIDAALADLAVIEDEPLGRHIDVGETVQRVLQGRLGGLSGA